MSWDDFISDVKDATGRPGHPCGMKKLLDALPDNARDALAKALGEPELAHAGIGAALRKRLGDTGVPSDLTIARHRRGRCSCRGEET